MWALLPLMWPTSLHRRIHGLVRVCQQTDRQVTQLRLCAGGAQTSADAVYAVQAIRMPGRSPPLSGWYGCAVGSRRFTMGNRCWSPGCACGRARICAVAMRGRPSHGQWSLHPCARGSGGRRLPRTTRAGRAEAQPDNGSGQGGNSTPNPGNGGPVPPIVGGLLPNSGSGAARTPAVARIPVRAARIKGTGRMPVPARAPVRARRRTVRLARMRRTRRPRSRKPANGSH